MFTSLVLLVSLLPCVLATHESCSGSWTNPSYRANWTVEGDCVSFYVSATTDGWVGLGFSLNRFMPQSDVVVGAADDFGNSFVIDGYANSRSRPTEDGSNDLQKAHVRRRDGTVTLRFTRKLVTNDSNDVPLDQCVYLLAAWNGRVNNYARRLFSYHGRHRFSSDNRVCFPNATACPLECEYNGQLYKSLDTFNATDGCNTCLCTTTGLVVCTRRACRPKCPIEGQVYYGGDSCAPCDGTCEQPLVVCPLICRRGCGCPRGQVIDQAQNRCVALSECPKCEYNGQSFKPGATFNATDGCNTCQCTTIGLVACTLRACRPKKCVYNGQSYNPGDTFNATDGCNTCHCTTTGLVVCTLIACRPKMICPTPLGFGVCVEACSSDDDCALDERCCSNGCGHQCTKGTLCAAVLCLKPNCTSNDIIPPGPDECCGTCGCRYGGKLYSPGETFPSTDGCNTCTCSEGHVTCTERACIPTCPIEGQRYFDIRNGECVPCQQTCGQVPRVCILICRSGCGCPVGQLIDPAQNKCVNHSECTPECPVQGQIYYGGNRCAPCDGTCDRPLVPCPRICRRGCACPRGQVIDPAQNRCVALSACPPRCPIQGQRYFNASKGECVPCTGTCEDTSPICTRECRSGCGCPTGTVLDEENNRCIHPRTCPRKCEYEGEVYEPGDRWDCSDSGKCMKCWCLANGVVVNNTLGCPVICTRSLCERNANANCSISCSNTSILTSCRACYYDDDERSVPRKCRYKCGSNPSFNCLKKWGNCVRKTFNKKFGKARKRDRRDGLFKCATPTPCGE